MKINKVDNQVINAKAKGTETLLLFEFENMLRSLEIPFNSGTSWNKKGANVDLSYNYKQLKEKLKKFRDKKLI